jgi:6-pyruvoyltetrahydropterin/6-carboxytetrahydropterin synthase
MDKAEIQIFREYRLKFYLNARHYIIIGDKKGDTHPHTWEFALTILIRRKEFVEFNIFEQCINEYLGRFQDKIINEIYPFNNMIPTLENMVDYFTKSFYNMIREIGGELICVEGSEGPSRSYILDLREQHKTVDVLESRSDNIVSDIIDTILDDIID